MKQTLTLVPYQGIDKKKWDSFVFTHRLGWWWHTSKWIEYVDSRDDHENYSVALMDETDEIVRLDTMFLNGGNIQIEGEPGPMPLISDILCFPPLFMEQSDLMTEYFKSIWEARSVECVRYRDGVPCEDNNIILCDGEIVENVSWKTRVVPLPAVWSEVRKSYRPLITKVKREKKIRIFTDGEDAFEGLELFHTLHRKANQGETRPVGTWSANYEWLRSGNALLVLVGNPPVAGAYFIVYKGMAYYASGASLEPSCQHGAIWIGLEALNTHPVQFVELGWSQRPWDTEKYRSIAFFKSGFGGTEKWIRSIKYNLKEHIMGDKK